MTAIVGCCVLGAAPLAQFIALAMFPVMLMIGYRRRSRLRTQLEALPFPIEHSRKSAIDPNSLSQSAIRSVTVHLMGALDSIALERAARDAHARAPGLAVAVDGMTLMMTEWPWRGDDMHLLVQLLSTWGSALHAEHPIARVCVRWQPGGPPSTL
jgi:hypothetical protein